MNVRRTCRIVGLAAMLPLAACASVVGLSDFEIVDDAGLPEASSPAGPSPTDGGMTLPLPDGQRADADVEQDAHLADVRDAGDAAPASPFCASLATAPTFCDDFDTNGANVAGAWDSTTGTPRRTTGVWKSAPAALDALITNGAPTLLLKAFTIKTSITIDFDVQFPAIPAMPGGLSPFVVRPNSGGVLFLYLQSGQSYMQVSTDEYSAPQTPAPTPGVWHHVTASVTIGSSGTTFGGSFDGVAYDWSATGSTTHPWTPGTVTVEVGADPYSANGELFVDNVVVNVR